jgi:hypothetical protein
MRPLPLSLPRAGATATSASDRDQRQPADLRVLDTKTQNQNQSEQIFIVTEMMPVNLESSARSDPPAPQAFPQQRAAADRK